jgi:hypothetical protein
MASITAVELGAATCALVRTSVRGGTVRVSAAEMLDPAAFPGMDSFTAAVRQARRALKLPRRCRAVVWGLPDGSSRTDVAVKPLIEPLVAAGFRVDRVVSPCNALAALARLKRARGDGATCWLAINRGGVAIVVVRPGKQLYAHSFSWDSSVGASGSQARLLQRYSLVAFLAPEVKRAMAEARKHGLVVEAVVTCGNLPDLRSLTMPLIEELDVEVETLDSLEGLVVTPDGAERLSELASGIRLACAGLIARGTRPWDESRRRAVRRAGVLLRVAAVAAGVLGVGYAWYARVNAPALPALFTRTAENRPAPSPAPAPGATAGKPAVPKSNPPVVSAPASAPGATAGKPVVPKSNPPVVSAPGSAPGATAGKPVVPKSNPPVVSDPRPPAPVVNVPPKPGPVPPPVVSGKPLIAPKSKPTPNPAPPAVGAAAKKPESTPPRTTLQPLVTIPAPTVARPIPPVASRPASAPDATGGKPPDATPPPRVATTPARVENQSPATLPAQAASRPGSGLNTQAVPADKPEAARKAPVPALLKDPLPRVLTILVSSDRRFATIDNGQIIRIGDVLGRRVVVGIEERTVVLQEPSGAQIRVGLGGRLMGVGRSDR